MGAGRLSVNLIGGQEMTIKNYYNCLLAWEIPSTCETVTTIGINFYN
jgi:hypothetical protein